MASSFFMVGKVVHHVPTFFSPAAREVVLQPTSLQISGATKPRCLKRMMLISATSETPPPPLMEKDNEKEEKEEEETAEKKENGGLVLLKNLMLTMERLGEMEKVQFTAKLLLYAALVSTDGGISGGGGGSWAKKSPQIGIARVEINVVLLLRLPIIHLMGIKTTLKTPVAPILSPTIPSGSIDLDLFSKEEKKKTHENGEDATISVLNEATLYLRFLQLMFKAESGEVAKQAMDSPWSAFENLKMEKKRD